MSRPNLRSVVAAVVYGTVALTAAVASGHQNSVVAGDGGSAHVVNGVTTGFYPAVGALLMGDADNGRAWCSGTLIGCQTFLTAAHCVCPTDGASCTGAQPPDPSQYTVFFQHLGFVGVDTITVRPDYQFPNADIAVLKLSRPLSGVRPVAINTEASPAPEAAGTIVGFGSSGGGKADFGIMRSGRVVIAAGMVGQGDGLLGWYFRGPMGDPGSNANTCSGDSGGPLLVDRHGGWMLAGTTTGGQNGSCLTDDVSVDTDVFTYHEWIRAAAGDDVSASACGEVRHDDSIHRVALDDHLDDGRSSAVHVIEVPRASTLLRVTMNGIDDGRSDFNLDVRAPDASIGCVKNGAGQFALCEVPLPAPGAWQIRVDRAAGSGPYQLNVTTIGARTCSPTPRADCAVSAELGRPLLRAPRRGSGPAFTWRWRQAERGQSTEYGDPTAGSDYAFCVYDDAGRLQMHAALGAGEGWSKYRRGFTYRATEAGAGAIRHARLRRITQGRTTILLQGGRFNPIARVSRSNHDVALRAQLQGATGCWETVSGDVR